MKKTVTSNELIYFSASKDRKIDFSGGENCLAPEKRFEFLQHYEKEARRWHNDAALDKKAVSKGEIDDVIKAYSVSQPSVRKVIRFDTMTAFAAQREEEYSNFQLYCGAEIKEGEVVMADRKIRPTAGAKYILPCAKEHIKVSFDVYISKEYKCSQTKKSGQGQAGRTIELRVGTLDKVKIKFFNTGEIYSMSENMWTPKSTYLGNIKFNEYNTVSIEVYNDVKIKINGALTQDIKCSVNGKIDNIFFDGGMHPRGMWKIANLYIDNEKISFEKTEIQEEKLEKIGEVSLPYAIGSYKNRDKRLYLVKKFEITNPAEAILRVETLDPCGRVWINDKLVIDTDSFMQSEVCVSDALKAGGNEIKIMVEPRAPEVYYYWHRHSDCYNGWFCGEVTLSLGEKLCIGDVQVKTLDVKNGVSSGISVLLNRSVNASLELFAAECYPQKGKEVSLGKTKICGDRKDIAFSGDFKLWNYESPVLYSVRAQLYDENGRIIDDFVVETGFRTIEQKNGAIYLNGTKSLLNGALLMQFLPPLENVPVNHNCPTLREIIEQILMLKNMNGNLLRLHLLGYGTNDVRFARICDRLGIMLIWTTRLIDSAESLVWDGAWQEADAFKKQMREVINHPSIIMWEGSNEYHPKSLDVIDKMYDEFVEGVKEVDETRLICPCSHLYYGGGIYDIGCKYYNDNGTLDEKGNTASSGRGWIDGKVVRSTHTYALLCGYGQSWKDMREQVWKWQDEMLKSKKHAYLITEYAITALANPNTAEALANEYVESYERVDEEEVFGRPFKQSEWKESQAYQALCTQNAVKKMRLAGVDGMLWCCLSSGANNGSYLKPPIDFYGYKKLGFYALREAYEKIYAVKSDTNVSYGTEDELECVILNSGESGLYELHISIYAQNGERTDETVYSNIEVTEEDFAIKLPSFRPKWNKEGYYTIKYELEKRG